MGKSGPTAGSFYYINCKACGKHSVATSYKASTCLVCLSIGLKYCSKCDKVLPCEQFSISAKYRDGYKTMCKACHVAGSAAVQQKHAEAQDEAWIRKKQASLKYCTNRYAADDAWRKQRIVTSSALKKLANTQKRLLMTEQELTEERQRNAEASRKYYQDNADRKDYIIAKNHERRAREHGSYSLEELDLCKEFFNNACAYCGISCKLTIEHVVPIIMGGSSTIDNIIVACPTCNASKNSRDMVEWFREQDFWTAEREKRIREWINQ